MSYDAYMEIDTGGPDLATVCDIGNMTSNVSSMWYTALGGVALRDLQGKTGDELKPILRAAVDHITDPANRETYREMNPTNGWGDHESATQYLRDILIACERHPKASLRLSY